MTKKTYTAPLELPATPAAEELKAGNGAYGEIKTTVATLRDNITGWKAQKQALIDKQDGDPAELAKAAAKLTVKIAEAEAEIDIWLSRRKPAADALEPLVEQAEYEQRSIEVAYQQHRAKTVDNLLADPKVQDGVELIKAAIAIGGKSVMDRLGMAAYSIERGQYPDERDKHAPDVQMQIGGSNGPIERARVIERFHRDNRRQLSPDMKSVVEFA